MFDLSKVAKLQVVTNHMADDLANIRMDMEGRGVSPAKAALVQYKLLGIEQKLRQLGANENDPIPFD